MTGNNFSSKSKFSFKKILGKDESVEQTEESAEIPTSVVTTVGKQQHFFSVQKTDKKYHVYELIMENGKVLSNVSVYSNASLPVAIAKVGELVSRLTMMKRIY